MADKLDLILQKLDNHEARFDTLEKLVTQQGDMMVQLLAIVGKTNNMVADLKQSQARQDTEISEIKRIK